MNRSSAELKKLARIALKGKFGIFIGAFLIYSAIATAASIITNALAATAYDYMRIILLFGIQLILTFVWAIFSAGFTFQGMKAARGEKVSLGDIFYGFTHSPDRFIIITLLELLIAVVLFAPSVIFMIVFSYTMPRMVLSLMAIPLLLYIAALVFVVIISLGISLAYYLIIDNPEMSAIDSLKTSWRIMKGHKGRVFYLSLSFLGLMLLGMLSFGVAMMWVVPYANVTSAYFYYDVIGALRPASTAPVAATVAPPVVEETGPPVVEIVSPVVEETSSGTNEKPPVE